MISNMTVGLGQYPCRSMQLEPQRDRVSPPGRPALGRTETVRSQQLWLEGEASGAMAETQCLLEDVFWDMSM